MKYVAACIVSLFCILPRATVQAQLVPGALPADNAGKVGSLIDPAVLNPGFRGPGPVPTWGSCFLVDARGYVATTFSNVEKAGNLVVVFNNNPRAPFAVRGVVAASRGKDIAILALGIVPAAAIPPKLNAAADPQVGSHLMRWGGPVAEKAQSRDMLVAGPHMQSADSRETLPQVMRRLKGDEYWLGAAQSETTPGCDADADWLWLDQACQRNCLGGPAFDPAGDVVAMVAAPLDDRLEIATAIHIKHVVELLPAGAPKLREMKDLRAWKDEIRLPAAVDPPAAASKALGGHLYRGLALADRYRDLQRRLTLAEQEEAQATRQQGTLLARRFELAPQVEKLIRDIGSMRPEEAYRTTEIETRRVKVPKKGGSKSKSKGKDKDDDEYEWKTIKEEVTVTRYRFSARQNAILLPLQEDLTKKQTEQRTLNEEFRYVESDLVPFLKRLRGRISSEVFYLADPLALRGRAEHEALESLLTEMIDEGAAPGLLYLVRGMTRTTVEKYDAAQADLTEAIEIEPKLKDLAAAVEARRLSKTGQVSKGVDDLRKAVTQSKNDPRVLFVAARCALDRGDMATASRNLTLATATCTDPAELKLAQAWIGATSASSLKQTLDQAETAVRLTAAHDWSALLALAALHSRAKDHDRATAEAAAAMRFAPQVAVDQCRAWQMQIDAKQPLKREWK